MSVLDNTSTYSCLVFDWDGTLADSLDPLTSAFNATCDRLAIARPADQEALRRSFGNHSPLIPKELLKQEVKDGDFDQFIIDFEKQFASIYRHTPTILLKGAKDTLTNLKAQGFMLCVASNAPRLILDKGLSETATDTLFDYTVCADEFSPKPSPHMLEHLLLQCPCLPEKAVMVGDHYNDILAAKAANMHAVGVLSGSQNRDGLAFYHPDAVLDDVNALPSWLDQR